MLNDIFEHKTDYSLLAIMSGIFIVYFLSARHDPHSLVIASLLFSIGYFIWGIWHHRKNHSITKHVVLEYFLVAVFGNVIVCSLLL